MQYPPTKTNNGKLVLIDKELYEYMRTYEYRKALLNKCKNNPLVKLGRYNTK